MLGQGLLSRDAMTRAEGAAGGKARCAWRPEEGKVGVPGGDRATPTNAPLRRQIVAEHPGAGGIGIQPRECGQRECVNPLNDPTLAKL